MTLDEAEGTAMAYRNKFELAADDLIAGRITRVAYMEKLTQITFQLKARFQIIDETARAQMDLCRDMEL